MSRRRSAHCQVSLLDSIFVCGGSTERSHLDASSAELLRWNRADLHLPHKASFLEFGGIGVRSPWRGATSMDQGRMHAAASTVDNPSVATSLVCFGGSPPQSSGRPLSSSERYYVHADRWVEGPPLPAPRRGHSAVTIGSGAVLSLGGFDSQDVVVDDVLAWDHRTPQDFVAFGSERLLDAVGNATAVVLDDYQVLIVGGHCKSSNSWDTKTLSRAVQLFDARRAGSVHHVDEWELPPDIGVHAAVMHS